MPRRRLSTASAVAVVTPSRISSVLARRSQQWVDALESRKLLAVVNVTAPDPTATEPTDTATIHVARAGSTAAALDVTLTFSGTANGASDYRLRINGTDNNPENDAFLAGSTLTIPVGASDVFLTLLPVENETIEPTETVTIGLANDPDYTVGTSATVTINDDDAALIQDRRQPATAADVTKSGRPSDLGAFDLSLSADGRYSTFISNSTDLVSSPLTTFFQVYRRDLVSATTRLVTLASGEQAEANNDAFSAKISADGRYVAYETTANNIVGGDENGVMDVYIKDMNTNVTRLVSKGVGGELIALSNDGEQVLFQSTTNGAYFVKGLVDQNGGNDLFIWNRRTGKYTLVSMNGDGTAAGDRSTSSGTATGEASFSGDGRFVVFPSRASNLVSDQTDGNTFQYDVFVRDIAAGKTEYASVSSDPTVSANNASGYGELTQDGRYVIFRSSGTNIVTGITDDNETQDIFVRDRLLGTTKLLSISRFGGATGDGGVGIPDITPDGRYAVFTSTSTNIVHADTTPISDAYLADVRSGVVELISGNTTGSDGGGAPTIEAHISDDGSRVAFLSYAPDLPGDFDKPDANFAAVYVRDTIHDINSVVSFERGGNSAGANSSDVILSQDGTRIGFSSESSTIAENDNNNRADVFTAPIFGHEPANIDANGKLTVIGSPVGDSINIQRVNSKITVRRDAQSFTFKNSDVTSIDVLTFDGDDSVVLGTSLMGAYVTSGSGNDVVRGGGGPDRIQGGPGRDLLYGGAGDDRIDGGKNNDTIYGESGSDRLYGGDSDDLIDGGSGTDRFFGGIGTDTSVKHESSDILDSIEELA